MPSTYFQFFDGSDKGPPVVRLGFTLVEMVVVILILGILASVAAPRLYDASRTATDNGLRQTLSVLRDGIDRYSVKNGALPGASNGTAAKFKSDIVPYLRGPFPEAPVGPAKGDNRVRMMYNNSPMSGVTNPNRAWKFDYATGEFIVNYDGIAVDGVTSYDDF